MKKFNKLKHTSADEQGLTFLCILRRAVIFMLIFCIISLLLATILALVLYNTKDPSSFLCYIGPVVLSFSSMLTGFIFSRKNGEKWLLCGVILGLILTSLIFVLNLTFNSYGSESQLVLLALVPLTTVIGSLLGSKRKTVNKHHKRHKFK